MLLQYGVSIVVKYFYTFYHFNKSCNRACHVRVEYFIFLLNSKYFYLLFNKLFLARNLAFLNLDQ